MQDSLQHGKYTILHEIGQGGMAVVYRGVDTALDREVAVKVLHPHLANRADSRMRLQREAKAVAKLHHPNILEIYDYSGLECDESYIVTEYIRGETLKDFTDRHTPSLPEVGAMIVHEVAAALAHAHEAGIIHRDIKPENIMIRDDGVLKLMDFGIAQIVDMQAMTVTGALVGSPAHMSPEHVEGKPLDFRADVFSLGTLLYFLCAGRLPFDSPSPHALLRQILEANYEDPRLHNPAIGRRLNQIITRCLARDPNDRYTEVADLQDDLRLYQLELGIEDSALELAAYFDDPAVAEADLTQRVVDRLMTVAREMAANGKVAMALEAYNQVLALQGDRTDALSQVTRLTSCRSRRTRMRWGLSAAMVAAVVTLLVWAAVPSGDVRAPIPNLEHHAAAVPAARPASGPPTVTTAAPAEPPVVAAPIPAPAAPIAAPEPAPAAPVRRAELAEAERQNRRVLAEAPTPAEAVQRPTTVRRQRPQLTRVERQQKGVRPSGPQPEATASGVTFKIRTRWGSEIHFDGQIYRKGYTPDLTRSPGAYQVRIHHPECDFCVDRVYSLRLDPKRPPPRRGIWFDVGFRPANLVVTGAPAGATVRVAGKTGRPGESLSFAVHQPRPSFQVRVSAPGHAPAARLVQLEAGKTTRVNITLQSQAAPE